MLGFRSFQPTSAGDVEPAHPVSTLSLHFGAIAKIRTPNMGHGEVTFDASHRFHGAWDWDGTPCHANGTITVADDLQRADVHLIVTHGVHTLANERISFNLHIDSAT